MFPSSDEMNRVYGGQFPKATRVFYSDFSDDPWQRASVNFSPSEDEPYFLTTCDDCGHCKDLHSADSSTDPEALQKGRAEFETYLAKWLQ